MTLREVAARLRALPRRARGDRELDAEIRAHIDLLADQYRAHGMSPEAALERARREFGNTTLIAEEHRAGRGFAWLDSLAQDFRHAARLLRKNPGFTAIAALTLALGMGANTAVFSLVYAVLLRPLPYLNSETLVAIHTYREGSREDGGMLTPIFSAWRAENVVLEQMAAWNSQQPTLTGAREAERLIGVSVTAGFFPLLGVPFALGRPFTPDEDRPNAPGTVVLTDTLWSRQFNRDPNIIGRAIRLDDRPHTVVGVMRPGFRFPGDLVPDIYLPDRSPMQPDFKADRFGLLRVIARLKPGIDPARVSSDLTVIAHRNAPQLAPFLANLVRGGDIRAIPLERALVGDRQGALVLLTWAVAVVVLIACVNVAHLQLSRAAVRSREIAVRAALGASRGRIARLLFMESLLISTLGAMGGLAIAYWAVSLLKNVPGVDIADVSSIAINQPVLLMCGAAVVACAALFGAAPMIAASRVRFQAARSTVRGLWLRRTLLAAEVGLALMLLAAAGVLLRSFMRLMSVDPGFRTESVFTARLGVSGVRYNTVAKKMNLFADLEARLRALPKVESVGFSTSLPFAGHSTALLLQAETSGEAVEHQDRTALTAVQGKYVETMGMSLLAGRHLDTSDRKGSPKVAVVNLTFARRNFGSDTPLGRRFRTLNSRDPDPYTTIVGVVKDLRHNGLDNDPFPEVYVPFEQWDGGRFCLAVRTSGDPAAITREIRAIVAAVDSQMPIYDIKTMTERLSGSVAKRRFQLLIVGCFAVLAFVLAAAGIYGVVSYTVAQRTREIGVRVALGAAPGRITRAITGETTRVACIGAVAGLAGAFAITRLMKSFLYKTTPFDPVAFAGATLLLIVIAVVASYLPARRAASIDPMITLRDE